MSEPRDVTPGFIKSQIPTDFSCLKNTQNCLPCNLDGITEKAGRFLVFELKHGDNLSVGQERMLQALAALPQFDVLIVECVVRAPNEKGARPYRPATFTILGADGKSGDPYFTSIEDMAARYDVWCRCPNDGVRPFTCSPAEFEREYARYVAHRNDGPLAAVRSARPQ